MLRFLAILSILLITVAFMLSLLGADYTRCFDSDTTRKRNLTIWSGLLLLLAGLVQLVFTRHVIEVPVWNLSVKRDKA